MSPPARMLRIAVTGSECTGKTTMAAWLAHRLGAAVVPEAAREHLLEKDAPLGVGDVDPIARRHIAAADAAAHRAGRALVLDTDLVSTVIYARHYYGSCPEWIEREARARLADLYLLHHPDVPWLPDGLQRDRPGARWEMHARFRDTLEALGARVIDVKGGWDERREIAARAVEQLMTETAVAKR